MGHDSSAELYGDFWSHPSSIRGRLQKERDRDLDRMAREHEQIRMRERRRELESFDPTPCAKCREEGELLDSPPGHHGYARVLEGPSFVARCSHECWCRCHIRSAAGVK